MQGPRLIGCILLACAGVLIMPIRGAGAAAKRILFVAGEKSHAPGAHEFPAGSRLLANALNASGLGVSAEVSLGWPGDVTALERADLMVLYSDGLEKHVARGKGP